MPVKTHWESHGFVFEAIGVVTAEEIFTANEAFLNIPKGTVPRYQIFNTLKVEKSEINEVELVDISADDLAVSRKFPEMKIAFIANEGPVMEKLIKYLKISWAINTSWDFRIFTSMEAARDWLDQTSA